MQNCTIILQWEKILDIYKINVTLSNKKVILFSVASRLTYGSQSKTEVGLCVTLSLGRERVLELAGDSLQQGSSRNSGLVKTEGSNKVWATPRGQGDATQQGQGTGRGQWSWAMAEYDLRKGVCCVKYDLWQGVRCVKCTCTQGALSCENWICGHCQGCMWAAALGMEAAPLPWLLCNDTWGHTQGSRTCLEINVATKLTKCQDSNMKEE